MTFFRPRTASDRGASMVEYGMIVAVIALMALSAVTLLGDSTEDTFNTIAAELEGQDTDQGSSGNESDAGDQSSDDSYDGNSGSNQDDEQDSDDEQDADQQSDEDADAVDDEQDSEDDQGSDDSSDDTQDADDTQDEDEDAGPSSNPTESAASFYWWNSTKNGGEGAWTASVTYRNDTNRHQYLDLEITRVDEKGKETVNRYEDFYVSANGSETYTHWSNQLKEHKGRLTGTVEVRVEVESIKTSDENWHSYTYEVDDQPVSVEAPETS